MFLPVETVFEAGLELSEGERLALVSRLLEAMPVNESRISLDDDAFAEELDRRFSDREGSVDWSPLMAE
jgi:hypothetical protein